MSRRNKKKQKRRSMPPIQAAEAADGVHPLSTAVPSLDKRDVVQGLIQKGNFKAAVDAAKEFHAAAKSSESEAILLDAYFARIRSMFGKNMRTEALALLDLVVQRHPASRARAEALRREQEVRSGNLDYALRVLTNPNLSPDERGEIEKFIRCELTDLDPLARCPALPADHRLRVEAAALSGAFNAVCSGPVDAAAWQLDEVPRRSPLAPWKMLIRSIAAFYRKDDAACNEYVKAVDPESAPARLVPVLLHLLSGDRAPDSLSPKRKQLIAGVSGEASVLRRHLENLENALVNGSPRKVESTLQRSLQECKRARPDLFERLRQHISVQMAVVGIPREFSQQVLGGATKKDAYFWQLMARVSEESAHVFAACAFWEEFRLHALHEQWFSEGSVEEAMVYAHMADALMAERNDSVFTKAQAEFRKTFDGFSGYYAEQSPETRAAVNKRREKGLFWIDPAKLFERACAISPDSDFYRRWIAWAEGAGPKAGDDVALKWSGAVPHDPEPLLYLVESTEKRGAYGKALGFLEQAETVDRLNPAVGRARMRLLIACAKRHITDKKPHLLRKDIEAIQALPQMSQGDYPAFIAALKWAASLLEADNAQAGACYTEVGKLLQGEEAAYLMLSSLARESKLKMPFDAAAPGRGVELLGHFARACQLGKAVAVWVRLPEQWSKRLTDELSSSKIGGTAVQYQAIAETALHHNNLNLCYLAAGAGLRLGEGGIGSATDARFLLLRAQSVPPYHLARRRMCFSAAVTLARRHRDTALAAEIVAAFHEQNRGLGAFAEFHFQESKLEIPDDEVQQVLKIEKGLCKSGTRESGEDQYEAKFRHHSPPPFAYGYGDDFDDDEDYDYDYDDYDEEYDEEYDDDDVREEAKALADELMNSFKKLFKKTSKKTSTRPEKQAPAPAPPLPDELTITMGEIAKELIRTVPGPFGPTPPYEHIAALNPELAARMKEVEKAFRDRNQGCAPIMDDYMRALKSGQKGLNR